MSYQIQLTNIIPNPSFESDSDWSGIVYDTAEKLIGSRSSKLYSTVVSTAPATTPVVGHKYYGRSYIKSSGNVGAADDRFEWFAGDGYGLNFVFAHNNGNYPDWTMRSAVVPVEAVNGSSYIIRNFVVAAQNTCWTDGLMIVDLTSAFGAGKEPSQLWCDQNIPFFSGTITIEACESNEVLVTSASISPNPAQINSSATISVSVIENIGLFVPYKIYSGDIYAGEV